MRGQLFLRSEPRSRPRSVVAHRVQTWGATDDSHVGATLPGDKGQGRQSYIDAHSLFAPFLDFASGSGTWVNFSRRASQLLIVSELRTAMA